LADLLGCLAGLILILLRPGSFSAALTGTMVMGLSIASIFPTTMTFAGRRMQLDGRITGWFLVGSSAGQMFLPWLIGQLFESIGPHTIILAILVDVVLAIGVFGLLMVYTRPKAEVMG
jgi:FHS family Na+ dependent glucose MFS transporter 1